MTDPLPLDSQALTEIEERAAAASQGPWTKYDHGGRDYTDEWYRNVGFDIPGDPGAGFQAGDYENADADVDFVITARTDVPRLVATVRAAWALEAVLRENVAAIQRDRNEIWHAAERVKARLRERAEKAEAQLSAMEQERNSFAWALTRTSHDVARLSAVEAVVTDIRTLCDRVMAAPQPEMPTARAERFLASRVLAVLDRAPDTSGAGDPLCTCGYQRGQMDGHRLHCPCRIAAWKAEKAQRET